MARRTYSPNALEPVLASGMTGGSTTVPLDSATGLTAPGYMVIDPDDIAKREFFKFETINSNTLEDLTRGLTGSAGGAVAHDAGATVRTVMTSQALDDLFLDIIDLETDQHTIYQDSAAVAAVAADDAYVKNDGDTMTGALAMGNQILSGPLDPAADGHVGDRAFNDGRYSADAHTVASHDTDATGAELDTLTDGSNADALHAHSGDLMHVEEDLAGSAAITTTKAAVLNQSLTLAAGNIYEIEWGFTLNNNSGGARLYTPYLDIGSLLSLSTTFENNTLGPWADNRYTFRGSMRLIVVSTSLAQLIGNHQCTVQAQPVGGMSEIDDGTGKARYQIGRDETTSDITGSQDISVELESNSDNASQTAYPSYLVIT